MPEFSCPYWEQDSHLCLLVEEGIFLPIEAHISTYCLTSLYALCNQYEVLVSHDQWSEQSGYFTNNRRRSVRIPSQHLFRYTEITGSDHPPSIREDDAWTVDLSAHGIRFSTRRLLPPKTMLRFEMVKGDKESIAGIGRVVWSKPIESSQLFHSAIVFSGHHTIPPP